MIHFLQWNPPKSMEKSRQNTSWLLLNTGVSTFIKFSSGKAVCHTNTLRPRQNGHHFPDDIFKCIFFNENVWISLKISLKFVPNIWINSIPALVQIMAWRRPGDKPLSEPMVFCLLTHIYVTRPQWVKDHLGRWSLGGGLFREVPQYIPVDKSV